MNRRNNGSGDGDAEAQVLAGRCFAGLRGLCRCPFDQLDEIVHPLVADCLSIVPAVVRSFTARDDLNLEGLLLLRDAAEVQLPSMNAIAARALYTASLEVMKAVSERLMSVAPQRSNDNVIWRTLELLNHLVTKDLQLDDNGESNANLVSTVLLSGLEITVPLITSQLLQSFPSTCDRYFSFLSLLLNSYGDQVAVRVAGGGGSLLEVLVQQLLWAAGAVDSVAARLALQVPQQ